MTTPNKVTRKGSPPIKVYCLPDEKGRIEHMAAQAGMTPSRFLREIGQGYRVTGIVDYVQVRELARINGDLGRLGGLLKLWLTDDAKVAQLDEHTIRALLRRIEGTQDEMGRVMMRIVMPRATL
ncbi:MAG: conjugal transfer transcriptional regulator TraJ [Halothiobacillus sp.]|nr:conjugal transfer transcriptional regulator TraJ [Halothiobacillus sp.]